MKPELLLPLVAKLKACPERDANVSRDGFLKCWEELRRTDATPFTKPPDPIMAALLLDDDQFAELLDEEEQTQLLTLITRALARYEQITNPPNRLGKLLAGIIKTKTV
ncbi:MAG: hypothetical protein IH623_12810 [Verrucomicrobia bacterium]|nr:hypothetical protein [Verrucomicrobiota bacterium]